MTRPHPRLIDDLQAVAGAEGFVLFGIAPAVPAAGFADLIRWIEMGYAGEMDYFEHRLPAYRDPSFVLDDAQSIIMLAFPYDASPFRQPPRGYGKIARYVWRRDDYHDTIHRKLKQLCKVIVDSDSAARARGVVDTAPLMERELAQLAGLGWRAKNTLLLNKQYGSYFFLAAVLTSLPLPVTQPHPSDHCGTCTACLQACPTDAFPSPGVLDATRCISYLTIEHRGPIPRPLRGDVGDWLFGCDVCQEVCPWNRKPQQSNSPPTDPLDSLDLCELFTIDDEEFRRRFRRTPLWRARRRGILRNAAIVLGNQRDAGTVDALRCGLNDDEPIIRGAAAWALGRIGGQRANEALEARRAVEQDETVCGEIDSALA